MIDHCADCGGPGDEWCTCCVCSAMRGDVLDLADLLDITAATALDLAVLRARYNAFDPMTL